MQQYRQGFGKNTFLFGNIKNSHDLIKENLRSEGFYDVICGPVFDRFDDVPRLDGQQPAIDAVSEAYQIFRAGLSSPDRPLGSFLFLGPTGTGKTNLVSTKPLTKREVNELPPDARFRIDAITSEKRIGGLIVTDLNGDGRPDLVETRLNDLTGATDPGSI